VVLTGGRALCVDWTVTGTDASLMGEL